VDPWFKADGLSIIYCARRDTMFFNPICRGKYKEQGHDGKDYEIYLPGVENIEKLVQARAVCLWRHSGTISITPLYRLTTEGDKEIRDPVAPCTEQWRRGLQKHGNREAHAGRRRRLVGKHPAKVKIDDEEGGNSMSADALCPSGSRKERDRSTGCMTSSLSQAS